LDRKLNVLIVGSGGREHALLWKLGQSNLAGKIFIAPGNGGTDEHSVPIASSDIGGLLEFARKNDCFTIVGPEVPLSLGIVDTFHESGLPVFGPTKQQARIETSKVFAKGFMRDHSIPTARFEVFIDSSKALDYSSRFGGSVVVKADGLASGKGVFVCSTMEEAEASIRNMLELGRFGEAGRSIVVEERLTGREVSIIALCDGKSAMPFGSATDHKRLSDGDLGPNTGGMGAYSPSPGFASYEDQQEVVRNIIEPVVAGTGFRGFLYAGLMLTKHGPKVLEYNARLGDPETQALLPRLETDLLRLILRFEGGGVGDEETRDNGSAQVDHPLWSRMSSCCVAMCARGYPESPMLGDEIRGLEEATREPFTFIFHSGTKREGPTRAVLGRSEASRRVVTSGGRVLYVTSLGENLGEAVLRAYSAVDRISWPNEYHRRDIGRGDGGGDGCFFSRPASASPAGGTATAPMKGV
jgi:phosphoribosylamine--glycine ligase